MWLLVRFVEGHLIRGHYQVWIRTKTQAETSGVGGKTSKLGRGGGWSVIKNKKKKKENGGNVKWRVPKGQAIQKNLADCFIECDAGDFRFMVSVAVIGSPFWDTKILENTNTNGKKGSSAP